MIDREKQFLLQAEENARLQADHAAEVERIADEIIDKILAEEPGRALRLAREAEAYEQAMVKVAARIQHWGAVETDSLPAIRRALAARPIAVPVALTLAYSLGLHTERRTARNAADREGMPA
ncbi:MAG: hypothetical protein R6X17_04460 [Candidatus Competibacteraceae bacterium]